MFKLVEKNLYILSKFNHKLTYNLYKNQILPSNDTLFNFDSNTLIHVKNGTVKINFYKEDNNFISIFMKKQNNFVLQVDNNIDYNISSSANNSKINIYYNEKYYDDFVLNYNDKPNYYNKIMNLC